MPEDPMMFLYGALALFGAALLAVATRIVKAWGDKLVDKITDEGTRAKAELARDEVFAVVDMITHTTVAEMRAKSVDGKLTKEEAAEVMATAVGEARRRFSPEFWQTLMGRMGLDAASADEWIRGQAEAHIFRTKEPRLDG